MKSNDIMTDKTQLINTAAEFLNTILGEALKQGKGEIEIRTFPRPSAQYFYSSVENAARKAVELCGQGKEVYFGVNPRTGRGGKKKDVEWVSALHTEVDYGKDGHKKVSPHADYDEALAAINRFEYEPTLIIHSGGGFHCYWVLSSPINVKNTGVTKIENINIILSALVGGDKGTQDISRVLRIPGTYNFKLPDNPRPVILMANSGNTYELDDFDDLVAPDVKPPKTLKEETTVSDALVSNVNLSPIAIDRISVSERIKNLIRYGNDGTYASRSDADFAVILALTDQLRQIGKRHQTSLPHAQDRGEVPSASIS